MNQSEHAFRRLAARFQRLAGPGRPRGRAIGELAECQDRLVGHIRERDAHGRDALWLLLWAALPDLVLFTASRMDDRGQANDLAQQVLTAVLSAYDRGSGLKLEHGAASFYEYLYTAARRELVHHRRRPSETLEVLTPPEDLPPLGIDVDPSSTMPEFPVGTREFWQWVDQASRHLPAQVYDLVFLAERQGLTDAELVRVMGPPVSTNVSVYKKRARETFIDWFAVLWVARSAQTSVGASTARCATLSGALHFWNGHDPDSFTADVYALVRAHIGGCALCQPVFLEFKNTKTGGRSVSHSSNLLAKFRTLPVATPVPEALRRWLDQQRTDDGQHRRRTLLEVLIGRRPGRAAPAEPESAAAPAGAQGSWTLMTGSAVARAQSAAASVARRPAVSNLVETVRNNPGLTRLGGVVIVLVVGASTLAAAQPDPPSVNADPPPATPATSPPPKTTTTSSVPTPTSPPTTTAPTQTATSSRPPGPALSSNTTAGPRPGPGQPAAATCSPNWQQISSPTVGPNINWLTSGAASGPDDVWAVGQTGVPGPTRTVTMHYDGTTWSVVPSPSPGNQENYLSDVASLGPGNAWATGWWYDAGGDYNPLLMHWDGTAWTSVASPSPPKAFLGGITALSPSNIWIVGNYNDADNTSRALTLHWNGTAWTRVSVVSPVSDLNTLWAVSGTGPDDIWTVGGDYDWSLDYATGTLIEHWNGDRWTVVPHPNPPGARAAVLFEVTARTPTDAWASGWWLDADLRSHALAMHWDGTAWSLVTLPDLGPGNNDLYGVVAFSATDVWALGTAGLTVNNPAVDTFEPGTGRPLVLHWDGSRWTVMNTATPAISGGRFFDAVQVGNHEVWGIGNRSNPGGQWYEKMTTLTQRIRLC